MKASTLASFLLGFVSVASAQTLAPSPTESVGCEPHGDHWHCAGPATGTAAQENTATTLPDASVPTATTEHDHHHESETESPGTVTLAPSPTESVGCHPHGDHWHCEGPATATTGADQTSTDTSPTSSASEPAVTAGAPAVHVAGGVGVVGLAAAMALIL